MQLKHILLLILSLFIVNQSKTVTAQIADVVLKDCFVSVTSDSLLVIKNQHLSAIFDLKNGMPTLQQLNNSAISNQTSLIKNSKSVLSKDIGKPIDKAMIQVKIKDITNIPAYIEIDIIVPFQNLQFKNVITVFPESAALKIDYYTRNNSLQTDEFIQVDEQFAIHGKHWVMQSISFKDATDNHNTLVYSKSTITFAKPEDLKGNILIAKNSINNQQLIFLKEAPLSENQLYYPGYDFRISDSYIAVSNLSGIYPDAPLNTWMRNYGLVIGLGGDNELDALTAIRDYFKHKKAYDNRYEMIMMNTWGDRGKDGRLNEKFAINEIELAKKMEITHFQLDDGWQQGLSKNSESDRGNLWDNWEPKDWLPHAQRFSNGLEPVVDYAQKHNVELGLWFHPSNHESYANWKADAEVVLNLYHKYGIKIFKIDGIEIHDKVADINLRNFFDTIAQSSDGNILVNVDVTAGRRGGYFYLNEYGNIFLENRYTDWGTYYPYQTLRNLWMLSRYVPTEWLQVEFLNNWRNVHRYDSTHFLAPVNVPFDYTFAITFAAQPLAWFEASGLPDEAIKIKPLAIAYKKIMNDFHSGNIFPIGDEPNGTSWTGFQSMANAVSGYFLIYREYNISDSAAIKTWLPPGTKVKLTKMFGSGDAQHSITNQNGEIIFQLSTPYSYACYKYLVDK